MDEKQFISIEALQQEQLFAKIIFDRDSLILNLGLERSSLLQRISELETKLREEMDRNKGGINSGQAPQQ